jgi:UDP-N-acetyl-D-glucosamine dehydrogenase
VRPQLTDVLPEHLVALDESHFSTRYALLRDFEVILISVPTPLRNHESDLSAIEAAARASPGTLRPGTLVALESTTYPGPRRTWFRPLLEQSGMKAGRDFALVYDPNRRLNSHAP